AGELPIGDFRNRAQSPGETQGTGDDLRQLYRSCGDQPHAVACLQVLLGELASAREDPLGNRVLPDLLRERHDLCLAAAAHDLESPLLARSDIRLALGAGEDELRLLPREARDVPHGEETPGG